MFKIEADDNERVFYHGSPLELRTLASGSTVTPNCLLAEAFSHKPTLLVLEDNGTIRHNGRQPGHLYIVEGLDPKADLVPHPRSSMPGNEWLTRRDLSLRQLGAVIVDTSTLLSEAEECELRLRAEAMRVKE